MTFLTFLAALVLFLNGVSNAEVVCKAGAIDLVFVMDQSGSVGEIDYKIGLQAAQQLTRALEIGPGNEQSHVGFVRFDSSATVDFTLDKYLTNDEVSSAIGAVDYSGDGTNIASGMHAATTQVFQPKGRPNVPQIMILITDGGDSSDVAAERSLAMGSRVRIYALGVGSGANMDELIAATGDVNRVYPATDYSKLQEVMNQICEEIAESVAPAVPTGTPAPPHSPRSCGCGSEEDYVNVWLDVAVVIDSSSTVAKDDFDNVVALLDQIGQYYTIGTGAPESPHKFTRLAIINVGNEVVRYANFSTYATGADLSSDVQKNLKPIGGIFDPEKGIKEAQNMFDEEEQAGRRLNVRKVLVVFSSASIDCRSESQSAKFAVKAENKELCRLVAQMQDENVAIISVAMKLPEETSYPFMDITGACDRLHNDEVMVENLMRRLCLANCYCLSPYTQFEVIDGCERFGDCLFVHNMALSYSGAQKTCAKENDTLTDALSAAKDDFVKDLHLLAGFFPYWIGGKESGNTIKWDSGVESNENDYSNWGPTQPDGKNQCVFMKQYQGFKTAWYSDKCGMMTPTHFFSCQKDACSVNNYCEYEIKKSAN